jgi:hypothetical protein
MKPSRDSMPARLPEAFDRRSFLRKSLAVASTATLAASFEERALLAYDAQPGSPASGSTPAASFPAGKIGKLTVSRLICGGNLISGFAHSRDLIYVSELLKSYFTDAKVIETLGLSEQHGLNTAILRLDDNTIRLLGKYRQERHGKLQWIAQVKITETDQKTEIQKAIDHGAAGAFVHGGVGDEFVKKGRVELLGRALQFIKQNGAIAGLAGHTLAVVKASEKAELNPDFYMKTFNSKRYWSASIAPRNDSVWEETPEETAALMEELDTPWIAYKVLGAGAIHPREGFQYAYQKGADFICAGMFDFQIAEDVEWARLALEKNRQRNRQWIG